MAEKVLSSTYRQRRDTSSNWIEKNPILNDGELGFETDTKKFKIGDGIKNWKTLEYVADNASYLYDINSGTSFQIWIGTQEEYNAITSKNPKIVYMVKWWWYYDLYK